MLSTSQTLRTLVFAATLSCGLQADAVYDSGTVTFTGSESTLVRRPYRDAVPSDWSVVNPWPGLASNAGPFLYKTLNVPVISSTINTYVQVIVDDPGTAVFVSAYRDSFTLGSGSPTGTNYLGDEGSSGNLFGNPNFFSFVLPANSSLVLLVNTTTAGTTGGASFKINLEAFSSSDYDPLPSAAVPEPVNIGLSVSAIGLALLARRRQVQGGSR